MMEKFVFDDISEIFLFRRKSEGKSFSSALNDFIAYLKCNKIIGPYKFTYVGEIGNLIPELTLKQNLLLDYTSASMTEEKEVHFKNHFKIRPNNYLEELYNEILNINELTSEASPAEIKLVCLIKALISDGPFLFFENPENDLDKETFSTFQKALRAQIESTNQNVFITTNNESNWIPFISKVVTRNSNFSFNTMLASHIKEFEIERKKFYEKDEESANLSHLVFHLPKKKSAA